jgi:hypothetical protein
MAAVYCDLHADPLGQTYLVRFFSQTRMLRPKGIIILDV